jgi:D-alanyl-D-alanine carboxypeptidase
VGSGNVLAGYHEHLRLPPASLTKVLTALVAISYLPSSARVPGTAVSVDAYPNDVGIEKGVPWPLHQVLESLLVLSANDAAYAIAGRVSGTLARFGPVMQRSATQIGMSDSPVLRDPAGLDGTEGYGGGNLVSARDLAIAGRDLLSVPELAGIVSQENDHFIDPTGTAHWLPSMDYAFLSSYPGAIGIKTGYTDRAGSCIMAAARRAGRTMLAVVMNGYNPTQTAIDLLNWGFATPARAERGADRLPAVALPDPHAAHGLNRPAPDARPSVPGGRRPQPAPPASSATKDGHRAGALRPAPGAAVQGSLVAAVPPQGLDAVVRSWPAQLLLILAGIAALCALWEMRAFRQLQQDRRPARAPSRPGPSPVASTVGSRRRRAQIIASYRRHQHP